MKRRRSAGLKHKLKRTVRSWLEAATEFQGRLQEAVTRGRNHSAFPSQEGRGGHWGRCSTRLAAGGLHLYLLEEGSSFTLDNWLQQRASPLAGGGTLRQVLIGRLHGRKPETNQSSRPTGCFTAEPARPPHQPQRPHRSKDGMQVC